MNGKFKRFQMGLSVAISGLVLLLAFNNCKGEGALNLNSEEPIAGQTPSGSIDEITGTLCEQDIKRFYSRDWHTFVKTNCASCHSDGPGKGRFATANVNEAFEEFMMTGQDKVAKNSTSPSHNPPATGTHHIMAVNEMKVDWMKALENFAVCSGDPSVIPTAPPIERIAMFSVEKEIGELIENTPLNQVKTLTWDINSEIFRIDDPTKPLSIPGAGTISIQVGRYKNSSGNTFYSFFNLTLNGNTVDMNIVGTFIRMNGLLLTYPTTFSFIDAKLQDLADKRPAGITSELISTGSLVAPKIISATDRISLQFIDIKQISLLPPPPPNPVNFITRGPGNTVSIASAPIIQAPAVNPSVAYEDPMEVEVEIGLARPADEIMTVTFSDVSDMCGVNYGVANDTLQSSMRRVNATTCQPQIYNHLCTGGRSDCTASTTRNEFTFMRARSVQGTTSFHRFDWDYKIDGTSVTFSAGQQYAKFKVYLSTNIRRATVPATIPTVGSDQDRRGESNRLLTFRLESVSGEGVVGSNVNANILVMKHNNPVPPQAEPGNPIIPRYQDMMSADGILQLNCVRCHNSTDMRGGYNITNYELMVRNGVLKPGAAPQYSEMYTRMSKDLGQLAKPMPQVGFMESDSVDIVKRWIEAGAPNN